jgi:hypothetical protein
MVARFPDGCISYNFILCCRARSVLEVKEYPGGIPRELQWVWTPMNDTRNADLSTEPPDSGKGSAVKRFPVPLGVRGDAPPPHTDISFEALQGDFTELRGLWRIQYAPNDGFLRDVSMEIKTRLSYALLIRPQAWVPVGLLQGRIEKEVGENLLAVAQYVHNHQDRLLRSILVD